MAKGNCCRLINQSQKNAFIKTLEYGVQFLRAGCMVVIATRQICHMHQQLVVNLGAEADGVDDDALVARLLGKPDHALTGALLILAFAGLVFGLAVSPIHLCLALSVSYFNAPLLRIVLKVLPAALCVAAAGFAMALLAS